MRFPKCATVPYTCRGITGRHLTVRHLLILGGSQDDRAAAAAAHQDAARVASVVAAPGAALPFSRVIASDLPVARPRLIRFDDLEQAFPNAQTGGTRLVLTQSTYLLQKWLDVLDPTDRIVATADRQTLERTAPEAFQRRGAWRQFEVLDLGVPSSSSPPGSSPSSVSDHLLARAYHSPYPEERLQLCRDAVSTTPDSAVPTLALASACLEQQDMSGARRALDHAALVAPDWEAVHYEDGKFWLGVEDMGRARDGFQRACDLMPTFAAAHSNLGATLGELDQPEAALAAFTQALTSDPDGFTILNNIGVVCRELGRLPESEIALRRVVTLAPDFVFGYYNLGHTLLLGRQCPAALAAYEEGQRRDPQKNRRQACRLAVARFANGDAEGAERDLWRFIDQAPANEREDLLLESYEIADALARDRPELAPHRAFLDRIAAELNR